MALMKRYSVLLIFILLSFGYINAQVVQDSVKIYFRQGYSVLDNKVRDQDNKRALEQIADRLKVDFSDSIYMLTKIQVSGGASPEAPVALNNSLSYRRANVLFNYMSQYRELPDSLMTVEYKGRDWPGLLELVKLDDNVPYKDEVIPYLEEIIAKCEGGEKESDKLLEKFMNFKGGSPYWYVYYKLFPELRASKMILTYKRCENPFKAFTNEIPLLATTMTEKPIYIEPMPLPVIEEWIPNLYLKTNFVGLGLAIANLGVEADFAKHWSVTLPVYYSAWNYFSQTLKFRTFSIQPEVRYWFDPHNDKWFLGAHFGLSYYNFAFNGPLRYQDHDGESPSIGGGISVGYRVPISKDKRWKLEFSVGAGIYPLYYDTFHNTDPTVVGLLVDTYKKTYFGIDQAAITLAYTINMKKGGVK